MTENLFCERLLLIRTRSVLGHKKVWFLNAKESDYADTILKIDLIKTRNHAPTHSYSDYQNCV